MNPGQDFSLELKAFVETHAIEAGANLTCVGSLSRAHLRFAQRKDGTLLEGPFEICGSVGTLSKNGNHVHLTLSDQDGNVCGGHLLTGNVIRTTAEVVIVEFTQRIFTRELDPLTSYRELVIRHKA